MLHWIFGLIDVKREIQLEEMMGFPQHVHGLQVELVGGGMDVAYACVCEMGMEVVMLFVGRRGRNRAWTGHDSSHGEMLAPALLTGSAVPIVTIRAVLWCARGDGFLCVGTEEL